jgi:hypothetical protein
MRTLLGWAIKLSVLGLVYVGLTSGVRIKLPEEVLGYRVPAEAQQWVDRNAQLGEYGQKTQASFQSISDSFGKK